MNINIFQVVDETIVLDGNVQGICTKQMACFKTSAESLAR